MDIVSKRFNQKFTHHWNRIIDFLKLHYVLSKRGSDYWIEHRDPKSIPKSLQDLLELWRHQTPWFYDELHQEEMFPLASFQYILYGMGHETQPRATNRRVGVDAVRAAELFQENIKKTNELVKVLPTHRELVNKIKQYGMQKI